MTLEEAIAKIIEMYSMAVSDLPEYERKRYGEAIAKVAMSCAYTWPMITYRDGCLPTLDDYKITCANDVQTTA